MTTRKSQFQFIWGIALFLAGIGVFYRIPHVMPRIESIDQFSSITTLIRLCFYFMGVFLIGGGLKKIYHHAAARLKIGKKSSEN